ncbi:hypothetical protein [Sediminicola sp. 1XM1-17]|uniref:hypothetical protein n=1 Tax=Sediminicola sp. 1XM1-17 TaxID=3127702 RepID=UPI003076EB32
MKNLVLLFTALIFGASNAMAVTVEDKVAIRNAYNYNNSFIFVEDGITFSVYPDGEFDFYIDDRAGVSANVNFRNTSITFNSGYDYNPYVQYDDYGAVIQVENIPIYYDYYGRVTQVGNVDISYNRGRVNRLGGLYVYYNRNGVYSHHTGFINVYNRYYVYRPFHNYFARPAVGLCLVYNRPYRRYYEPVRYTYYKPYYNNYRRSYAKFGYEHKYKKDHYRKSDVYRNDRRVVARDNHSRRNDGYRTTGNVIRRSEGRSVDYSRNNTYSRSNRDWERDDDDDSKRNNKDARKSNSNRSDRDDYDSRRNGDYSRKSNSNRTDRSDYNAKRNIDRNSGESRSSRPAVNRTVTKREVSRSPRNTTVTRTSTSYKKPEGRDAGRTVTTRTQKSVSSKPSGSRNSRSSQVSSRTSAPKSVGKASTSNRRSGSATTSSRGRSSRDF